MEILIAPLPLRPGLPGACAWCNRRDAQPLAPSELCETCLGLCAFGILRRVDVAAAMFEHAHGWLGQVFSFTAETDLDALPVGCWWCSRPGETHRFHCADGPEQVTLLEPELCPVCSDLIIAEPPQGIVSGRRYAAVQRVWATIGA